MHKKLKVFICHSSDDKPAVREIFRCLKSETWIEPWLDEEEIYPGQDWDLEIENAVEKADAVLVFLSNNSVSKEGYVQREIQMILQKAEMKPEGMIFTIPLRLEACSVPRRLSMWQYVDFFPENRKDWAYRRLLGGLRIRAEKIGVDVSDMLQENRGQQLTPLPQSTTNNELDMMVITHPVPMEFIRIPAGNFLMGNNYDNELPQHNIHLSEYYIGKYPITNIQYATFVEATKRSHPKHWVGGYIPKNTENHPVVHTTWFDAVAFCEWLAYETDQLIHLPSEAEWEKAARGTDGRMYPWGNAEPNLNLVNIDLENGITTPVDRHRSLGVSPYGCADMVGNVWEWTSSLYKSYPYNPMDGRENLTITGNRVLRGGAWYNYFNNTISVASVDRRIPNDPSTSSANFGFRCSCSS